MLVAYVKSKPDLSKNFHFEKTFVFRDTTEKYINQCKDSDILLCSCYVWNWEITKELAKKMDLPIQPGSSFLDSDAKKKAREIGYPIIIKAALVYLCGKHFIALDMANRLA